eukprot:g7741.t1
MGNACKREGQSRGQAKKDSDVSLSPGDSYSKKSLTGWFSLHAVGTGKRCLVKHKTNVEDETEEFGDTATAEAFIHFFGVVECEEGDKGNAKGRVCAWVIAEAYEKGGVECVAKVLAAIEAKSDPHKIHRDVSVQVGAITIGSASVKC